MQAVRQYSCLGTNKTELAAGASATVRYRHKTVWRPVGSAEHAEGQGGCSAAKKGAGKGGNSETRCPRKGRQGAAVEQAPGAGVEEAARVAARHEGPHQ